MVSALSIVLAHGADPTPLAWDEALANLVKFSVTFILIASMSYPILGPLLKADSNSEDGMALREDEEPTETPQSSDTLQNRDVIGWIAVALLVILAMFWWLARASLVEVMTEEAKVKEDHAHAQNEGGQVAMWADFHAEVVRVESGEVRVYLRDSYNRDIAARFFDAEIQPLPSEVESLETPAPGATATPAASASPIPEAGFLSTESSLNDSYRFARLSKDVNSYRIRVSTPGWTATLKFLFDGTHGKRSLPIWCNP